MIKLYAASFILGALFSMVLDVLFSIANYYVRKAFYLRAEYKNKQNKQTKE